MNLFIEGFGLKHILIDWEWCQIENINYFFEYINLIYLKYWHSMI